MLIWEQYPDDPSHDPQTGLDMSKDFAGGLAPLGYAALTSKGWQHPGPVTLADQERITADYLAFLARVCRQAGLPREQIWTHAGGQYAPWPLHYSHRSPSTPTRGPAGACTAMPPPRPGTWGRHLRRRSSEDWCAAEWLPTRERRQSGRGPTSGPCPSAAAASSPSITGRASGGIRRPLRACAAPSRGPGLRLSLVLLDDRRAESYGTPRCAPSSDP